MMNGLKKSDEAIRPVRAANKGARASAESPEERASTKGNPDRQSTYVDAPCSARRISNNFSACGQVLSYVRPLKCSIHALRAHMVFVDRSQIAPAVC